MKSCMIALALKKSDIGKKLQPIPLGKINLQPSKFDGKYATITVTNFTSKEQFGPLLKKFKYATLLDFILHGNLENFIKTDLVKQYKTNRHIWNVTRPISYTSLKDIASDALNIDILFLYQGGKWYYFEYPDGIVQFLEQR